MFCCMLSKRSRTLLPNQHQPLASVTDTGQRWLLLLLSVVGFVLLLVKRLNRCWLTSAIILSHPYISLLHLFESLHT